MRELAPQQLKNVSEECLTAGGLNAQLLIATRSEGWFDELQTELDRILTRVE